MNEEIMNTGIEETVETVAETAEPVAEAVAEIAETKPEFPVCEVHCIPEATITFGKVMTGISLVGIGAGLGIFGVKAYKKLKGKYQARKARKAAEKQQAQQPATDPMNFKPEDLDQTHKID